MVQYGALPTLTHKVLILLSLKMVCAENGDLYNNNSSLKRQPGCALNSLIRMFCEHTVKWL